MTCPNCERAKTDANWPLYQTTCHGCTIRQLAGGPVFFECAPRKDGEKGRITPAYKTAMVAIFGDAWKDAHEEVKTEYARLQDLKRRSQPR